MSDKPIQVGDLVVQIRACCAHELTESPFTGIPFVVNSFFYAEGVCDHCGSLGKSTFAESDHEFSVYVKWLKRIPPLDELESEQRKEEIEA